MLPILAFITKIQTLRRPVGSPFTGGSSPLLTTDTNLIPFEPQLLHRLLLSSHSTSVQYSTVSSSVFKTMHINTHKIVFSGLLQKSETLSGFKVLLITQYSHPSLSGVVPGQFVFNLCTFAYINSLTWSTFSSQIILPRFSNPWLTHSPSWGLW